MIRLVVCLYCVIIIFSFSGFIFVVDGAIKHNELKIQNAITNAEKQEVNRGLK